jgi:hypothetical protein
MTRSEIHSAEPTSDRVRRILAARGLTLAEVSRASERRFPSNHLHHIPHNFYHALYSGSFSPSLHQVFALSVISGYQFVDWLMVFGFFLDHISRFQASFSPLRTVELDATVYHPRARIPWLEDLQTAALDSPIVVPLSRWLTRAVPHSLDSLFPGNQHHFRYVKIGSEDAFAFPEVLPGSVVRVNLRAEAISPQKARGEPSKTLFVVEHSRGLICARLQRSEPRRIVLCPGHLPYAPIDFEEGTQAVVLGAADLEFRPLGLKQPVVPPVLGRFWTPNVLERRERSRGVGEWIRQARERCGLSFREASERTRHMASILGEPRYSCAPSSLSDCETRELPPRHIHKLIAICAVYCLSASRILRASGLQLDDGGQLRMPDEFLGGSSNVDVAEANASPSHFIEEMEHRFGEIPFFLREALPFLFGINDLSVRDLFWAGGPHVFTHRYLTGTFFLVVDRKRKTPKSSLSSPTWAQPLYLLQLRDGRYLCAACSLQNGTLMLRPCLTGFPKVLQLRNKVDADVVGKVIGVVRTLP